MNIKEESQKNTNLKEHKITINKLKRQVKGITLIALVVTIIVLLILAGVAINLTVGDNGLFRRAQNAADIWQMAKQNEQSEMEQAGDFIDDYANNITRVDGVPIPNGFYYASGSEETGLVISDNPADKKDWAEETATDNVSTNLQGNQFIWVPIENPKELFTISENSINLNKVSVTTIIYSNLNIMDNETYSQGKPGELKSAEPDILGTYYDGNPDNISDLGFNDKEEMAESLVNEYIKMSDSVIKYKGFYVGRYEVTGTIERPLEKKGKVLNSINWYDAYRACKNLIINNENVESTMIYGVQWDSICKWLEKAGFDTINDSSNWGNISGNEINTGSNEVFKANEIYDFSGNYSEWTQETYLGEHRSVRGGSYNLKEVKASARGSSIPTDNNIAYTSRPVLIIALNNVQD